ncbi:MAG: VOC family protein, partial [Solirubrobacterales bacterium]|nr:VOC family protein [Solirubrobacterales bacterium]
MADLEFNLQELVIATDDVEAAAERWKGSLGVPADEKVSYPQAGIEIEMSGVWVGDFRLAFVSDSSGKGPVSKFLEKRGEGLFEICIHTNDLEAAVEQMKSGGMRFTSEEPHILRNYEWKGEIFSEVHVM